MGFLDLFRRAADEGGDADPGFLNALQGVDWGAPLDAPQPQAAPQAARGPAPYDASDDTPGLPWGAASAESAPTPSPTRAAVATGEAKANEPQGLLGKVGHAVFGTHESGTTFGDRLLAASMGLQGNFGGEGAYLQGITERTRATADAKAKNQAFNESWIPGKDGKPVFSQSEFLKNLADLGYRGDTMAAISAAKGLRDKYEITEDALHRKLAINPYEPSEKPTVVSGAADLEKGHYYQVPVEGGVAPSGAEPPAMPPPPTPEASAGAQGVGETAAGVPTSPIEPTPQRSLVAGGAADQQAIAGIESRGTGNYAARGPVTKTGDRAYGRYQVMGANIPTWTKEVLGTAMTPQQFLLDPKAQDAVFKTKFGQFTQQYGSPEEAASVWFTGKPLAQGVNRRDQLGTTGAEYVQKFTDNRAAAAPSAPAPSAAAAGVPAAAVASAVNPGGLTAEELKQLPPAAPGMQWAKTPDEKGWVDLSPSQAAAFGVINGQRNVATNELKLGPAIPAAKGTGRLPAGALTIQNNHLEALQTASSINTRLSRIVGQIDNKELVLGPVANLQQEALNLTKQSTPQSRNYESLRNSLEKMRNDSLRLNKGVQTEGDAQRAWKELVAHITDPAVVRQRLEEIQDLNQQAIDFRKESVAQLREDAGLPAIDIDKFLARPLPKEGGGVGGQAALSAPPMSALQEGKVTTFKNKQQWTTRGGKPVYVGMAK